MNLILALIRSLLRALVSRSAPMVSAAPSIRDMPGYFSPEYRAHLNSDRWRRIRRLVLASTLGRDVLFPFLPATQVDHIGYRRLGKERVWLDVVPLHPSTHRLVTALRDAGHRRAIDALLRIACVVWGLGYGLVLISVAILLLRVA